MYDDDEDDDVSVNESNSKKERIIEDPIVLMRQGFGAGQQAFRLFYGDDSEDKDEVKRSPPLSSIINLF